MFLRELKCTNLGMLLNAYTLSQLVFIRKSPKIKDQNLPESYKPGVVRMKYLETLEWLLTHKTLS